MQDLHYDTFSNDKHNGQVKTWTENGAQFVQMSVDGRVRSFESLGPVGQ
jgi:hypothetical protein